MIHPASKPLASRTALVTGSTAGIGLAAADALAAMGADLVLNGFGSPEVISDLCKSLSARHSVQVTHIAADVIDPAQVEQLVRGAQEFGKGRLDILVNNAGLTREIPIESFPADVWDHQLALNLSSAFHTIRHALSAMRAQGWGRIVNVASVHGLVAVPFRAGYVAAKHGLVGLTKAVALETAGTAITCNAVCPGMVATDRVLENQRRQALEQGVALEDIQRAALAARHPSGNFISPGDVGAAIAYLCGPFAGEMRGMALTVDGGWTAR